MTILGSVFTVMAILFFGTLVAGSQLCACVEMHERQAMGIQGPEETY
jgi:hypothetical protein